METQRKGTQTPQSTPLQDATHAQAELDRLELLRDRKAVLEGTAAMLKRSPGPADLSAMIQAKEAQNRHSPDELFTMGEFIRLGLYVKGNPDQYPAAQEYIRELLAELPADL